MIANGLITRASDFTVAETLSRFETALRAKGIAIFARIDHAAGARQAGLIMNPMELLIFGNPKLGTPMMQARLTLGIDLPSKALCWEDEEHHVWLTTNDMVYLADRHALPAETPAIALLNEIVESLARTATSGP